MKRLLCLLLCCMLIALPALAEKTVSVQEVGRQSLGDDCLYELSILRIDVAEDGRALPPVYALSESSWLFEEGGGCLLEDVNFDGHDDLALITVLGATNARYTFYLWDEEMGTYVWYGGDDLWNYVLLPERGLVISQGTSGMAGLLHEKTVYEWSPDGKELLPLRTVNWDTLHTTEFEDRDSGFAVVDFYDDSIMVEIYHDYRTGEHTELQFPVEKYDDNDFALQRFEEERLFLGVE